MCDRGFACGSELGFWFCGVFCFGLVVFALS